MYKRIKKYNLNASDKQHGRLMLKNLFTSLLLNGKIKTTERKAKELKRFALSQMGYYKRIKSPMVKKTWLKDLVKSRKYFDRVVSKMQELVDDFKISDKKSRFRAGDGALMIELTIINFDKKKNV